MERAIKQQARRGLILAAAAASVAIGSSAWAATYTYTPDTLAGASRNWNNAGGQNNWVSGFPDAAGDVANVTADITGTHKLLLNQTITIGMLNLGDPNGSSTYEVNSGTLTFDSGVANVPAAINVGAGASGTVTHVINADVTLNSALNIHFVESQSLTLSGTLATHDNALTITGDSALSKLSLNGDIGGSSTTTIIKNSAGALSIGGSAPNSYTGNLVLNRGATTLANSGPSLKNLNSLTINGAWAASSSLSQSGGSFTVGSNSTTSTNPGQRLPGHIVMNSGALSDEGQQSTGAWNTAVHDDVDVLRFNSGYNRLGMTVRANSGGTELAIATLERGAGATVFLSGVNTLGNTSKVTVGNIDSFLIGAGGGVGTTNRSIIPWIAPRFANANGSNPEGFATYDASTGIRTLAASEYLSTTTFDADVAASPTSGGDNVMLTGGGFNLAADRTINSLSMTYAGGDIGAGRTLTINSGGIFFVAGGRDVGSQNSGGQAKAGTVNFGSAEGMVWIQGNASSPNAIGAAITGTGGLTVSGNPVALLILTGANDYSGRTTVSSGILQVGNATIASRLGTTGDVEVANGAILRITNAADGDAIADSASVYLDQYGLAGLAGMNGVLDLGAGINETVAGLYLGGVAQVPGTYGSTGSGAAYVDDTFFSGSGMLTVVPEPGSLGVLALAGLLGLRRRRAAR